jgi:hypothetical protein
MMHLLIWIMAQMGFVLLLSAMARHQQDWLRRKLSNSLSQALRGGGFALLILAFVTAAMGFGWGYGAVLWCGWLSVAAAVTVALNINRDKILARLRP